MQSLVTLFVLCHGFVDILIGSILRRRQFLVALTVVATACSTDSPTTPTPVSPPPTAAVSIRNLVAQGEPAATGFVYHVSFQIQETGGGSAVTLNTVSLTRADGRSMSDSLHNMRVAAGQSVDTGTIEVPDHAGSALSDRMTAAVSYADESGRTGSATATADVTKPPAPVVSAPTPAVKVQGPLSGCLTLSELPAVLWTVSGSVKAYNFYDPQPGCAPTLTNQHDVPVVNGQVKSDQGQVCGRVQYDLWEGMTQLAYVVVDSGKACGLPHIATQPQSQAIAYGDTPTLRVTATGTAPLSYQWYMGPSGATANPIAGASASSYQTPSLYVTTSYWVRVTNSGGSTDSTTATITVDPLVCVCGPPLITTQPQSQTIAYGATATLSVSATGPILGYQWYVWVGGSSTPAPGASTGSSYVTPPLTSTTSYWVLVKGMGPRFPQNRVSMTATITVNPPDK